MQFLAAIRFFLFLSAASRPCRRRTAKRIIRSSLYTTNSSNNNNNNTYRRKPFDVFPMQSFDRSNPRRYRTPLRIIHIIISYTDEYAFPEWMTVSPKLCTTMQRDILYNIWGGSSASTFVLGYHMVRSIDAFEFKSLERISNRSTEIRYEYYFGYDYFILKTLWCC